MQIRQTTTERVEFREDDGRLIAAVELTLVPDFQNLYALDLEIGKAADAAGKPVFDDEHFGAVSAPA